jgi:hypothetical protein
MAYKAAKGTYAPTLSALELDDVVTGGRCSTVPILKQTVDGYEATCISNGKSVHIRHDRLMWEN